MILYEIIKIKYISNSWIISFKKKIQNNKLYKWKSNNKYKFIYLKKLIKL